MHPQWVIATIATQLHSHASWPCCVSIGMGLANSSPLLPALSRALSVERTGRSLQNCNGRGFLFWLCCAVFPASNRSACKTPGALISVSFMGHLCPEPSSKSPHPGVTGQLYPCHEASTFFSGQQGLPQGVGPRSILLYLPLPLHPLLLIFGGKNTQLGNDSLYSVFTVLPTGS